MRTSASRMLLRAKTVSGFLKSMVVIESLKDLQRYPQCARDLRDGDKQVTSFTCYGSTSFIRNSLF